MRILTYIPVFKRREITRLCYESLKRTQISAPAGFSFVTVIAASNTKDAELADQYGFDVFICDNLPLGRKFNQGLEYALDEYNFDYVMQINSDNVLSTDFWPLFEQYFNQLQFFFGVDRVYFYDSVTKQMREFQYGAGCGIRFIRRDIVETAGFVDDTFALWDDPICSGLDNNSSNNIVNRCGKMQYLARHPRITRPVVTDIKSDENIHPFSEFRGAKVLTEAHRKQVMRRFPELKVYDERMVMEKQKV
jgi:glycosyltransferase involved in cell wall biosynthesis